MAVGGRHNRCASVKSLTVGTRGLSAERQPDVKAAPRMHRYSKATLVQTTFPRLMQDHARQRPQAAALREKVYGIWQTTTWAELEQLVRDLA
ncbi:MAG TPA: hypothetical protein VK570_15170, partial [Rubrivivax sp.]|nr:hypothetical protein [Rubrivivax sp.]